MSTLQKLYRLFCRLEEAFVGLLIVAITLLIFGSALARTAGRPMNFAIDLSLLLFAWLIFIGADVSLRQADFLRVEILLKRFPLALQKALYYIFSIGAIIFLLFIVRYGIPLVLSSSARLFQTLGISYAWATLSAPVGSALMIITIALKLVKQRHNKQITIIQSEAI